MDSFHYQFTVREKNLDSFGHMNNAEYLTFFEEARWEWAETVGSGFYDIHRLGVGFVVLEVHLQFRKEINLRDEISVSCGFEEFRGKIGTIKQIMSNQKGDDCCIAKFKVGFFDLKNRTLVSPTPEQIEGFGLQRFLKP